jgi:hypothetical protein
MAEWPRRLLIAGVALAAVVVTLAETEAQQGYEFGLRFDPLQFRPQSFGGFSFPRQSFRLRVDQPIQFSRINFPAFNSRSFRGPGFADVPPQAAENRIHFRSRENRQARVVPASNADLASQGSIPGERLLLQPVRTPPGQTPQIVRRSRQRRSPQSPHSPRVSRFSTSTQSARTSHFRQPFAGRLAGRPNRVGGRPLLSNVRPGRRNPRIATNPARTARHRLAASDTRTTARLRLDPLSVSTIR